LKPGETVPHILKIREWYGVLAPGRYDVRAEYEVSPGSNLDREFGLTPMTFDYQVAQIVVE
jgi:hypothetical protein